MTGEVRGFGSFFSVEALRLSYFEKGRKSKAVGRDGIRRDKFMLQLDDEIATISRKALAGRYRFTRYKERLIPKGAKRPPRQISIPTIRDRLALRALNDYLVAQFPDAKGELPHRYIREISTAVRACGRHHSFVRMDVQEFFPSVDHNLLLKELSGAGLDPLAIGMISSAIKNPTGGSSDALAPSEMGIPQGLSISNILSSIFLRNIDRKMKEKYQYWRYVDDILILCRSDISTGVFKEVFGELSSIGLTAHKLVEGSRKSDIVPVSRGAEYLGYQISDKKLSVRDSSYRKMFENLMKVFTSFKYSKKSEKFVFRLNLKISGCIFEGRRKGWIFFFSQTENMSQLRQLDEFVRSCCAKYAPGIDVKLVKRFSRAIYEIRHNLDQSPYFPRFDDFTYEQKVEFVSLMMGIGEVELRAKSIEDLEDMFRRCVQREVDVLEEDVQDSLS